MSTIASRIPYYVDNSSDTSKDLTVKIKIYDIDGSAPTDYQYIIQKKKYSSDSELLQVNISKFIRDYFEHTLQDLPDETPLAFTANQQLQVDLIVNGVAESHTAFDGWMSFGSQICASENSVKPIYVGSQQFIAADFTGQTQVTWSNGILTDTDTIIAGNQDYRMIPALSPNLTYTNSKTATVSTSAWERSYSFQCPYEDAVTIAFINKYGAWETFDGVGRIVENFRGEGGDYLSASGYKRAFGRQMYRTLTVNVGLVDHFFSEVIRSLMLSEDVWLYTGTAATSERLIFTDKSAQVLSAVADGTTVPALNFEIATPELQLI